MDQDIELLEAWRGGDRQAGSDLFERHFAQLYRFFSYKVGADTEDLIQKTLLACVEGRDRFTGQAAFGAYLFGIARRKLCDYWRERSRRKKLDFGVTSLADLGPSPSEIVANNREHRLLLEALRRIPLDLQIAIELHYWEGMTGPQLAQVLGIPEGTVRTRLRRAKRALEQKLLDMEMSAEIIESTLGNLEQWAYELKGAGAA